MTESPRVRARNVRKGCLIIRCRVGSVRGSGWRRVARPALGRMLGAAQESRELLKCSRVHIPFEFDHHVHGHPVVMPAPRIEFGMLGVTQIDVAVAADHAQEEPDLFLTAVMSTYLTLDEMVRYLVAQPVTCASDDLHVLGFEPDLLLEFAVHCLLWRFAMLDPALGKLPRMFTHPLAPPDFVLVIQQDNADVRAKAFTVQHVAPRFFCGRDGVARSARGSVGPMWPKSARVVRSAGAATSEYFKIESIITASF